jgi:hypothetical protein
MEIIQGCLPCRVEEFPIKYLGLLLSLKKLTKPKLQPLIDRLADLLPGWKSDLMTRANRVVHVQFVMTATVIYHAMALDLLPWTDKAINKIHRNYLWQGRKEALGGHCLIAWPKVTRPKELGGTRNFRPQDPKLGTQTKVVVAEKNGAEQALGFTPDASECQAAGVLLHGCNLGGGRWHQHLVLEG